MSLEFQSELAALLAHYAARMAAARGSVSPRDLAAALQAIANEQAVAMRALLDRWRTAEERQRAERPARPTPKAGKDDPGPS
ncbi:hypothetical protein NLM31_36775 [Bradyrhizobium sp. CCGUVB4N]|uniref:hypothetical protein n=1 Tax=Bradyrhizobium sp. CCGUVB4N TaxID=2949631 RepID=UPI0020B1AD0D|nr:hypothetical protein [Bradyrhizobium sp. CCGUVB4N]MCP3385957.1 hypothetical protein [Bradyrhizobium sp. CCGUVB4N]